MHIGPVYRLRCEAVKRALVTPYALHFVIIECNVNRLLILLWVIVSLNSSSLFGFIDRFQSETSRRRRRKSFKRWRSYVIVMMTMISLYVKSVACTCVYVCEKIHSMQHLHPLLTNICTNIGHCGRETMTFFRDRTSVHRRALSFAKKRFRTDSSNQCGRATWCIA